MRCASHGLSASATTSRSQRSIRWRRCGGWPARRPPTTDGRLTTNDQGEPRTEDRRSKIEDGRSIFYLLSSIFYPRSSAIYNQAVAHFPKKSLFCLLIVS